MSITVRVITPNDKAELETIRRFFRNFSVWFGLDNSQHDFDQEIADLPGSYVTPHGSLLFAEHDGAPAGCVVVRSASEGICELKRLYVSSTHRGIGVGRALVMAAIQTSQKLGYDKMLIGALPNMRIALKIYRQLGFQDPPAYYHTPAEGAQFMVIDIKQWSERTIKRHNLFHLFDFNAAWAQQMTQSDPTYFEKLSHLQSPQYLWIGCSDSRVPANQIVGLLPGEVFVHRNVANIVVHSDLNCLSVIQFAVDVLKVKHIMVVGHYGCGGVNAVLKHERVGLADFWLRHVHDVHVKHSDCIDNLSGEHQQNRLCEINVLEQVVNVCRSVVVQDAWSRGQDLTIHGWIYGIKDGRIRDLGMIVNHPEDIQDLYEAALERIKQSKS